MVTVINRTEALDQLPDGARPARYTRLASVVWTVGTRSLVRLALRRYRRRKADRVRLEYDGGTWAAVRDQRAWERADSLDDYLIGHDQRTIVAKIHGKPYEVTRCGYNRWRLRQLQELVHSFSADSEDLVELGCGFGYNILSLASAGSGLNLSGYDISENGIAAARATAAHFGIGGMTFGLIDLTDPTHTSFREIEGKTVLTFFCLEQIPYDLDLAVRNILAARPLRVINVEAATGARRPAGGMDLLNDLYVRSQDYQTTLARSLKALESSGDLRIVEQKSLGFGPTIHQEAFLFVWEPTHPR